MIVESVRNLISETMETREIGWIQVVGTEEPLRRFELLGRKKGFRQEALTFRDTFEQGVKNYRNQNWDKALRSFENCAKINPNDKATLLYLQRLQTLKEKPPGNNWDGVWRLTEK